MPQGKKLRTARNGQDKVKRKQVQVSQQVKQVTNPSRWKEEQRHLLKKIHHHPQTHKLARVKIPPTPQQQFPPRTPPRTPL